MKKITCSLAHFSRQNVATTLNFQRDNRHRLYQGQALTRPRGSQRVPAKTYATTGSPERRGQR